MRLIIKTLEKHENLEETLNKKEFSKFSFVEMEQTHSNNFIEIFEAPKNKQIIPNVDALITTKKNILLVVKTADCLPILIHWKSAQNHNLHEGIVAIHSGRVGTEKKILSKVIKYLKLKYGVGSKKAPTDLDKIQTNNLTIWLGPAICKECYQVDKKSDLHYDLYKKNIDQIEKSGMIVKIVRSEFCTLHNNNLFHSYRKSGPGVAMNYSLIGLAED